MSKKGKKVKKAKKLTQEQEDILGLAGQVMRLEESLNAMKVRHQTLSDAVRQVEDRLRLAGEALK